MAGKKDIVEQALKLIAGGAKEAGPSAAERAAQNLDVFNTAKRLGEDTNDIAKLQETKRLMDFHKSLTGDIRERAKSVNEIVQQMKASGAFPMEIGTRYTTEHSRRTGQPPWTITNYYVDPKNPQGSYGYYVRREFPDGGYEESVSKIRDPRLEALHGPEKWEELQRGFVPMTGPKVVKANGGSIRKGYAGKGRVVGDIVDQAMKLVTGAGGEEAAQTGIRAYHGSPHDFDKFDMSKIGTGEGAQAYGHGLYFADREGIARSYRDALATGVKPEFRPTDKYSTVGWKAEAEKLFPNDRERQAAFHLFNQMKNKDYVLENHDFITSLPHNQGRPYEWEGVEFTRDRLAQLADEFYNPGHMYEVNIAADPNTFLDWDKPLNEQSQQVRDALRKHYGFTYDSKEQQGWTGKNVVQTSAMQPEHARELAKSGIPGIRYLDAGSRVPSAMAKKELAEWQAQLPIAEKELADAVARGDSWLVARKQDEVQRVKNGIAAASKEAEGTRNYVVFDDRLISIIRKYGIAGASAMLGYNLMENLDPVQAKAATMADMDYQTNKPQRANGGSVREGYAGKGRVVQKGLEIAADVLGGAKRTPNEVFPDLSNRYPEVGAPVKAFDKKTGKEYLAKSLSPEAEAFRSARDIVQKDIDAGQYSPFFDVTKRADVDPSFYPSEGKTIDVMPKKQETRAKYRAMAFDPEGLARLRAGYEAGLTQKDVAENWYFMKQLEDEFIKELGEEEGRKQFKNRFAKAMALTTGGADPTSNLLMSYYGNYLKNKGLDVPQAAFDMPYPIGGRYASSNMSMFERNYGNELSPDNPKRLNFQNNFLGYKEPTIDEQMSKGFDPKLQMPEWYGPYEEAINTLAKEYNVEPRYFQEVTWAGLKSQGKGGYKGVPMIQHVNEAIERTSRLTGVPPEEVVRRGLVRAEMPVYSVAPVAGAAAVGAMGEEDRDAAIDEALTVARASGGAVERDGYAGRGRVLSKLGKATMDLLGPSERRGLLELTPPGSGYEGLPGKPKTVKLPGIGEAEARPIPEIMKAAEEYSAKRGLPSAHEISEFPTLDEAFAMRVAEEYDRMKHAPNDPAVRRAYDAMAQETLDQLQAAKDAGVEFTAIRGKDPYAASPSLGYADIAERGNLYFFPTDAGFGSSIEFDPSQNPLLKRIGRVGDFENATVNDAFRVVHDLYGHYGPGNPFFRAPGEERAYLLHRRMYSPEALPAMTSETRGQNSWLNFGPFGPRNRTAASEDTVFADQKTGIMDPFTYLERADGGVVDDAIRIAKQEGGGLTPYADDPSFRFREKWMAENPDSPMVREAATSMTDESLRNLFDEYNAYERGMKEMASRGYSPVEQNTQGEITSYTPTLREDLYAAMPTDVARNVGANLAPIGDAFNFLTGLENYANANYQFAKTGETPSMGQRAELVADMAPGLLVAAGKPIVAGVRKAAGAISPTVAGGLAGAGALTLGSEEAEAGKLNLFSRLNQAVEALPMDKMTAEQALAALSKSVPASELRWTGMLDYLKSNPKVNKAALAEFAQKNAVLPEETVIGGGIYRRDQVIPREEIKEKYRADMDWLSSAEMRMASLGLTDQARGYAAARQKLQDIMIDEEINLMGGLERRPQYKQWSSPGEDVGTYREHVFTMPGNEYVSSHYQDMPGYIGHMRTTQFSTPQGRIFVMDEAQSDLAQDLRREGEVARPEYRIVDQGGYYAAELMDGSGAMRGGYGTPEQAREAGEEMARKRVRKAAPYTESTSEWTDLALKRGLQAAAEADAKFFAWPPGKVQSARYDLEKQAETINFKYNPQKDTYDIGVSYGNNMGDDLLTNASPKEVERTVGKTVFEQIQKNMNTEGFDPEDYHSIPTRGMTIGGEGMKKYYDEIVPKRLQEVVRKATGMKVKPEKVKVPTAEGEMEYWGIPLTDEIKSAKWSSFSSGGEVVDRALALTSEV